MAPLDIVSWSKRFPVDQKPWLMLGKGPSYRLVEDVELGDFHVCSLNHVVRRHPVALAHIIDLDVVEQCGTAIAENAKYLAMPQHPHVNFKASKLTLDSYFDKLPVLRELDQAGRLVRYNLSSGIKFEQLQNSPVINVKYFSAEAALNLLVECGATTVRTLGVDGGASYDASFSQLSNQTLLANGHSSFDIQFESIVETISQRNILFGPQQLSLPVKVRIGTDSPSLPAKVLAHLIKSRASMSVDIGFVDRIAVEDLADDPPANKSESTVDCPPGIESPDDTNSWIYLDDRVLFDGDIGPLWAQLSKTPTSLYIDEFEEDRATVTRTGRPVVAAFASHNDRHGELADRRWQKANHGGGFFDAENRRPIDVKFIGTDGDRCRKIEIGQTSITYFGDPSSLPWHSKSASYSKLWRRCLRDALQDGAISEPAVGEAISRGQVHRDLAKWLNPHSTTNIGGRYSFSDKFRTALDSVFRLSR